MLGKLGPCLGGVRFPLDPKFPFDLIFLFCFHGRITRCCVSGSETISSIAILWKQEDLIRRVDLNVKLEQQGDWWPSGFEAYPK